MPKTTSFLSLDLGAGALKAAEFEVTETGTLQLLQFAVVPLGAEGTQEATREAAVIRAVKNLIAERGVQARDANICATGSSVFSKFVKLPPVDTAKVTQIIQYEAQQNVPFPLEEVVWDFQILGTAPSGELEVLLVAIKADVVEGLFRSAQQAGLRLQLVDVSPAALCNAFRYSYGELEGCTLLLDIGARSSNLLFLEKGKVYSRSINIGANSITHDFASESKLSFDDAERVKAEKGFVSLGGAYEEPDDPQAAAISKIARQVMTRLHIQVNQTIQFYRGQQGGSAPVRLFLAGGASIMPYTAQFFADKLNLAVEYFNPFRNVQIGPAVNTQELERVAHCFGEVVGLGLRNLAHCPVELNLMPKSSLKRQEFGRKRPYFVATVFCLVLVVFAYALLFNRIAGVKQKELAQIEEELRPWQERQQELDAALQKFRNTSNELAQHAGWMEDRRYWPAILTELRRALMQTERVSARPGVETGVWIESMAVQTTDIPKPPGGDAQPEMAPPPEIDPTRPPPRPVAGPQTNEIAYIKINCRGVNLNAVSPSANTELAFAFAKELQVRDTQLRELEARLKEPNLAEADRKAIEKQIEDLRPGVLFDKDGTQLSGQLPPVENEAPTFTFGVTLMLKRPIKL